MLNNKWINPTDVGDFSGFLFCYGFLRMIFFCYCASFFAFVLFIGGNLFGDGRISLSGEVFMISHTSTTCGFTKLLLFLLNLFYQHFPCWSLWTPRKWRTRFWRSEPFQKFRTIQQCAQQLQGHVRKPLT